MTGILSGAQALRAVWSATIPTCCSQRRRRHIKMWSRSWGVLQEYGLIDIAATLRPLITFKG